MTALLWLAWAVPLSAAALLPLLRSAPHGARAATLAPLPALALAMFGEPGIGLDLTWVLFGAQFGLDGTGRVFLLLTSVLWLIAGAYSAAYLRDDPCLRRYTAFFLVAQAGNIGVVLAQDIAVFYLSFALMTFSAFGLVVHDGSRAALRAGRVYIAMAVAAEAALIVAFVLMAAASDSPEIRTAVLATLDQPAGGLIVALLVAGFGVKVGLPMLHMWLPLAHPVAPTPASAVLSGSIVKAGVVGWLRFLPLGDAAIGWAPVLVVLGVVAMFGAAVAGVVQRDSKTVLAYSTVSQMGYLTVGVGAGLAVPQAWPLLLPAVAMYALHHGLAKTALFLGIGVARTGELPRWLWSIGLLLPAAALAGAPFTSGVLVKDALVSGLGALQLPWVERLVALLPFAAIATTLLMARVLALALREHGSVGPHPGILLPWVASLATVAATAWLAPAVVAIEVPPAWKGVATLVAAWPIAAGAAIAWLASIAARWIGSRRTGIPAGDVLVLFERLLAPLARSAGRIGGWIDAGFGYRLPLTPLEAAETLESRLQIWIVAGGAMLAIGLLLAVSIAAG